MFYNRFMEICREYGEKPTPVLKKLDISPGNLKRWEGGASITAETLEKIADYFGVSVDYFFLKDDEALFTEVQQSEMAIKVTRMVFVRFIPLHVSTPTILQAF